MTNRSISVFLASFISLVICQKTLATTQGFEQKPSPNQVVELMRVYQDMLSRAPDKDREKYRNPALEKAFYDFVQRTMDDEQSKQSNSKSVIWWSNLSANITFIFAHILLCIGIVVAIREWKNASKVRRKSSKESLEIEIKLESLALKGVQSGYIILVVSLVFYFMYLKFVYPIVYL